MANATDEQILNFLAELPDETDWEHPRRRSEGGSIEASRELAKLTESTPKVGLRIAKKLSSQTHQRPVSMVIEAAAKAGLDEAVIFKFIEECESRGFGNIEYRNIVARALEAIALRDGREGLPDSMHRLLRSWLRDADGNGRDYNDSCKKESQGRRIMFQGGIGDALPGGNYSILRGIFVGLINRQVRDFELWLTILEEHVQRHESPRVWQALAYNDLLYLDCGDRTRASALLATIFERFPELLDVPQGLALIDRFQEWLPEELTRRCLETLRTRGTQWHAQVFGELLVLRAFRRPHDTWALAEIEQLIAASSSNEEFVIAARYGVAFISALAVREGILLEFASGWLVRLCETEHPTVSAALLDVLGFNDPPPYDERMDMLLGVYEAHPFHLRHDRLDGLLHALHAYVKDAPKRVARLAKAVIDTFKHELGDMRLSIARYASDLVDLALTLQDVPGQLEAGLDLFESLQDLNLYEVEQILTEREAHPSVQHAPILRASRWRSGE